MAVKLCQYLCWREGVVTADQPDEAPSKVGVGHYCCDPRQPQTDQPLAPEEVAKCKERGDQSCWRI